MLNKTHPGQGGGEEITQHLLLTDSFWYIYFPYEFLLGSPATDEATDVWCKQTEITVVLASPCSKLARQLWHRNCNELQDRFEGSDLGAGQGMTQSRLSELLLKCEESGVFAHGQCSTKQKDVEPPQVYEGCVMC